MIKENKIWLGYGFKGGAGHFFSKYEDVATAGDHREGMIRVSGVNWFTNLEIQKRHEDLILYRSYNPEEYPQYADYDAINVDKTSDIPCDYYGTIGVPITFLDKYNPTQFEILFCCEPCIELAVLREKAGFKEYLSRQKMHNGVMCQKTYHRILIRRKQPAPVAYLPNEVSATMAAEGRGSVG